MKKLVSLLLVIMLTVAVGAVASAEITMGQGIYAAHGERAFCVATVAMDGDVIAGVLIDEYQFVSPEGFTGVPNAENFTNADGNVLGSKRLNDEAYSANMAERGGSTQTLATSYKAIEEFCVGKTLAELEEAVAGKTAEEMIDAVSSSTLADTLGYINSVIEAVKNAA